ncbi:Uncharacterised protein [uncultured archaeon]|nr:Uncharacterised protein [uncultured archaeon]
MKAKSLSLFVFAIFSFAIFASFASAAITVNPNPLTFNDQYQSISFTVTNTGAGAIDITIPTSLTISDGHGNNAVVSFNQTSITGLGANVTSGAIIATISSTDTNFALGKSFSNSLIISQTGTPTNNITLPVNFQKIPSEYKSDNNLSVSIDDLNVENGFGKNDQWFPLDEVSARIGVDNVGSNRIKDISVAYGLYDTDKGKWIFKDKASSFSLNEGIDKSITVNFKLEDLSKFNADNTNHYLFYAWVKGDDDGVLTSVTRSEPIEMQFENNFLTLDNLVVPTTAKCGESVQITADIANLGIDDQSDAYIKLTNTQLGLDKKISINDLNALETESLDYTFTIPETAEEGTYSIGLVVYNYRNNVYTTDFSSKESRFIVPLQVSGGCTLVPLASISAKLDSEAKPGQELTVKATITNADSKMSTFNLDLSDYSQWASLVSMDRNFVTLNAGESQDVVIKLKANSDSTGENKFNINLKQGSKTLSQPVLVAVKNGFSFSSITGFFSKVSGGNNFYLWGIGALNVILVLIIIFVAARVIRKK